MPGLPTVTASTFVHVPLVHFQTNHRDPRLEIHTKVAGYLPETQIISIFSVFLGGEENFQLIKPHSIHHLTSAS